MVQQFYLRFAKLSRITRTLTISISIVCLFGIGIHLIEPESFPTIFSGIWWAIITASTVGYGDFAPLTLAGRILAILLLLAGAGFLSAYFATLTAVAVAKQDAIMKGDSPFKGKLHLIIVGWNERAKSIIESLPSDIKVVIIDGSLTVNPVPYHHVRFIKGKAMEDDILLKANISEATKVILTADQNLAERQADTDTILSLLAIKGLNPEAECIVEILSPNQINNALRAGADEIIQTNKLASIVMVDCIQSAGMAETFYDLLNELADKKLEYIQADGDSIGKTFNGAQLAMLEKGKILIGIKRESKLDIAPSKLFRISSTDTLLVISNR